MAAASVPVTTAVSVTGAVPVRASVAPAPALAAGAVSPLTSSTGSWSSPKATSPATGVHPLAPSLVVTKTQSPAGLRSAAVSVAAIGSSCNFWPLGMSYSSAPAPPTTATRLRAVPALLLAAGARTGAAVGTAVGGTVGAGVGVGGTGVAVGSGVGVGGAAVAVAVGAVVGAVVGVAGAFVAVGAVAALAGAAVAAVVAVAAGAPLAPPLTGSLSSPNATISPRFTQPASPSVVVTSIQVLSAVRLVAVTTVPSGRLPSSSPRGAE